jgi:serralysin
VVSWDMNDGQVTSTNVISTSPANWQIAATGDYNGDGKSDILWRSDSGTVVSWDMNDAQVTSTNVISTIPTDWHII